MTENTPEAAPTDVSLRPLIWIACSVIVVWLFGAFAIVGSIDEWPNRGLFGDMFGALNALFSGLAFAGVIFTVHLQRKELSLQRKELELTRGELKRSAVAQEASEKALNEQAAALKIAARLNGLSSLIEHYEFKIQATQGANANTAARQRRLQYIEQLEQLLDSLSATQGAQD